MPSAVALIGARAGSERVTDKNVRPLAGHPLLAYAIETARQSGVFERVVVSTDSDEIAAIARWYGADVPCLRPAAYATATSPDIEWLAWTLERLEECYDLFAIVRATNPFRGPDAIRRGLEQLLGTPEADSIRAVELVKQHPGKMWTIAEDGRPMKPLLDQSHLDVAWHAGQYQALPRVYVQNSALEIAWTRVVTETDTREGRVVAPFLTHGLEGLNIDDEDDFARAEELVAGDRSLLPSVHRPLSSRAMRLASLETLSCAAGWRPWLFVKATTEDGLVGWSEVTDSHGSPTGLAGRRRRSGPLVVGKDPRAFEAIHWDLVPSHPPEPRLDRDEGDRRESRTRCSTSPARRTASRSRELLGGPTRSRIPLYWSHCGTTRARAWEVTGTAKLDSYEAVRALGARGGRARLRRVQDEHRRPR